MRRIVKRATYLTSQTAEKPAVNRDWNAAINHKVGRGGLLQEGCKAGLDPGIKAALLTALFLLLPLLMGQTHMRNCVEVSRLV